MTACPNGSGCPACIPVGDNYLIVGTAMRPEDAPNHGARVADHEEAVLVPKAVIDDAVTGPLKARIAELEAERTRYIEPATQWAVRLSRGTVLEFHHDEQEARRKAQMYRCTLLCCDVLSTDWREVAAEEPTP